MNRFRQLLAPTVCLAFLVGSLTAGLTAVTVTPAHAAARITVTNDRGSSAADSRYQTKLTISGNGFQTIKGGFGGVYLMFGWVKGNGWKPSQGGITGRDYRYIPDSENANNQGYLKFIAFPGSSTASEAHAILKNGSFKISLTVPGPRFQSVDRNGKVTTVDCTKVTCGVITIGAHGVKNPANETFTPVRFTNVYDAAPTEQDDATATTPEQPASPANEDANTAKKPAKAAKAGPVKVTTDRLTAKVGNAMTFTATGFTPGEQVVGVLDDGLAAIGPLVAGPSGEIAGVLQLPLEMSPGTHELRLTGAASGSQASERFAVRAGADDAQPAAAPSKDDDGMSGSRLFLVIAGCVFLLALITFVLIRLLGRSRRPSTAPTTAGA